MAIPLTGTGGLFTRLGRLGRLAYLSAGDQAAAAAALTSLVAQYPTTDHNSLIAPVEFSADALARSTGAGLTAQLQSLALQTLLAMVTEDVPSAGSDAATALSELIRQMEASSDAVEHCVVAVTPTALTSPANTGSGVLVTSTRWGTGLVLENAFADLGRLRCTRDSYSGGAAAGSEGFTYVGEPQTAGLWDYDYPTGSGATGTGLTSRQASDGPLTNTDFEAWAGSPLAATGWSIQTGVWAADAARSATAHTGAYSLKLAAGATLTDVYQDFPAGALNTQTSLAVNLWLRTSAGTASGGVLTVELTDSSGTVTTDRQGVQNSFTVDLTALTTAWSSHTGVFRVPQIPPSTLRLRLRVSSALSGADVLVDDLATSGLTPLYPGGPGAAVFSGATPWLAGDGWSVAVTNSRGGAAYLATFQSLFDRLFGMRGLGLLLPSGGTPTIPDSLITTP